MLEINEDIRESDKVVSEALLTEKDLKGVVFEERDDSGRAE